MSDRNSVDRMALTEALIAVLGNGEVSTVDGSMGVDRTAPLIAEAYSQALALAAHQRGDAAVSEPTTGPVHDAQVALVSAIQKRTWEAAGGIMVPGGGPVNEAIRAFRAAIEREAYEKVRAALTSEDEVAHGEAYEPSAGGLGVCAYCDGEWPCRTQRGIDRLLAAIDTLMGDDDGR